MVNCPYENIESIRLVSLCETYLIDIVLNVKGITKQNTKLFFPFHFLLLLKIRDKPHVLIPFHQNTKTEKDKNE